MARRRRQAHELERVLGANALFATAYGNVGSSIYYALGLVAGIALGLTPLVFIVSGLIFAANSHVWLYPAPLEALCRAATGFERALLRCGLRFPFGGSLIELDVVGQQTGPLHSDALQLARQIFAASG